jgi:hypothetical protein
VQRQLSSGKAQVTCVTHIELRHELDAVRMALEAEVEAAQTVARKRVRATAHHHRRWLIHLHDLAMDTMHIIIQYSLQSMQAFRTAPNMACDAP